MYNNMPCTTVQRCSRQQHPYATTGRSIPIDVDIATGAGHAAVAQGHAQCIAAAGDGHRTAATIDLIVLHQYAGIHAHAADTDRAAAAAYRKRITPIAQLHTRTTGAVAGHLDRAAIGHQTIAGHPHAGRSSGRRSGAIQGDIAAIGGDPTVCHIQTKAGAGAVQANRTGGGGHACAVEELNPHALWCIAGYV